VNNLVSLHVQYHIVHYHKLLAIIYPSAELIESDVP
jgi:hypothetical protein